MNTPRRRRTRPSSAVLSLLATITHATPLMAPPSFLCPSIDCDNPTPPLKYRKRIQLADKFEQGPDGRWRQVDGYTLYGSTVCSNCQPTSTGIDNAIGSNVTPTSSPISGTSKADQFNAKMPSGWDSSLGADRQRVTVILAISLVLSVLICFFISGFIIWRKKRRARTSDADEEIRLTRRTTSLTEEELNSEQEAKARQKFWARQSTRWKMNIRASARRRKNRRLLAVAHNTAVVHSSAVSIQHGPALSRSTSISTIRSRGSRTTTPTPLPPSSPPAYIPGDSNAKHTFELEEGSTSRSLYAAESQNDDPIPYEEYQHSTGHLATDDKNMLSQMTRMASAPEGSGSCSHAASAPMPVWYDEAFEEALNASREPSGASLSMSLPPPPSKGTPQFYEDPYSFEEDVHEIEPSYEPSAPPFEEHGMAPSAPPLDDNDMVPSAPPFMEDDMTSAPPPANTDNDVGQDHDRLGRELELPSYRV